MQSLWSKERLLDNLKHQLASLALLCEQYDMGLKLYALDIAHKLRVLLHQTTQSHSLIHQLGLNVLDFKYPVSDKVQFMPSIVFEDGVENRLLPSFYIIYNSKLLEGTFLRYQPLLNNASYKSATFDEWWDNQIICNYDGKFRYTRQRLINVITNKSGGSHVAPNIKTLEFAVYNSEAYVLGWDNFETEQNIGQSLDSPFFATIRQIAHEVFVSLQSEADLTAHLQSVYFNKLPV